MKIAHISDLHLSNTFKEKNRFITQRLIEDALENGAEHFVVTGDIADNAQESDFLIFREILEKYNLLRSERTSIVIGNHDIFGGVQTAEDVLNFPYRCLNTDYDKKVNEFVSIFKELFENTIHYSKNEFFPYIKELKNTILFGVNSVAEYSKIKNPFASCGKVTKKQYLILDELFEFFKKTDKKKILMIHHHFYKKSKKTSSSDNALWDKIESYTMKLRGKKKLFKLFLQNKIDLVLHGHSHEMCDYHRKGIRFLNAGASVEGKSELPSYFMIDDQDETYNIELKTVSNLKENISVQQEEMMPITEYF
ncbi:metallophosphoesterase [Melioribacteraceae bacterium 4301-Me]|uniref:metallophosphoesterase family protein n=1 Tax=Pyranulibacter aquaticus TaxID=3163344 RepID=UPI00359B5C89